MRSWHVVKQVHRVRQELSINKPVRLVNLLLVLMELDNCYASPYLSWYLPQLKEKQSPLFFISNKFSDLTHANLSGATISHSYLVHANLSHADLTNAILTGADLTNAHTGGIIPFTLIGCLNNPVCV